MSYHDKDKDNGKGNGKGNGKDNQDTYVPSITETQQIETQQIETRQTETEYSQGTNNTTTGNPITVVNLNAEPGQWIYQASGLEYIGKYHQHEDGTYMIGEGNLGAIHEIIPTEIIIPNPSLATSDDDTTYGYIVLPVQTYTNLDIEQEEINPGTSALPNEYSGDIIISPREWLVERVPNITTFLTSFSNLFNYNCYLAGGYLRRVLKSQDALVFTDNTDLDFWFQTTEDLVAGINLINNNGIGNYTTTETHEYSNNKLVYQYDLVPDNSGLPNLKVQLINRLVGQPANVLAQFDFTNAKIATNGVQVFYDKDFEFWENKNMVNIDIINDGVFRRLIKYLYVSETDEPYELNKESAFKFLTYVAARKSFNSHLNDLYETLLSASEINYDTLSYIEPILSALENDLVGEVNQRPNIPLNVGLI